MALVSLPSANQGNWIPGTDIGVNGGIAQYRPGGANERLNAAGIDVTVSIPSSSLIAAGVNTTTTATATGGSTSVVLADASSFAVGQGIGFRHFTRVDLAITSGTTSNGTITITLNGVATNVSVTTLSESTAALVAAKIKATTFSNATCVLSSTTSLHFAVNDAGDGAVSASFSGAATGVTAGTPTLFPVAYAGMQRVTVSVSTGATSSGDVTITLNGTPQTVAVTAGDTAAQVTTKLVAATYANATQVISGTTACVYTTTDRGSTANCSIDGGSTGVTGTRSVAFSAYLRRITAVAGNTITVDTAIPTGFTTQEVYHDDSAAIQAAINAVSSGQVVYLPTGNYLLGAGISTPHTKDNYTIRGDGPGLTVLEGHTTASGLILFQGAGGMSGSSIQTVTGTKTKGTETLTVASTTGYVVGEMATIFYENEEDETRIQAGATPTWTQIGYTRLRRMAVQIKEVASGTSIKVYPPLVWDGTDVAVTLERHALSSWKHENVGLEDFSFKFNPLLHVDFAVNFNNTISCWAYNVGMVEADPWAKTTSAGSIFRIDYSHKIEIRHCDVYGASHSSSDGVVQPALSSCGYYVDNLIVDWDYGFYNSGGTVNEVYQNNFILSRHATSAKGGFLPAHVGHPSLDIYEGNVAPNIQIDGYHGSSSHLTFHRNWIHGTNAGLTANSFELAIKRFNHNNAFVGNVYGVDGTSGTVLSYGGPNIGNGDSDGTAQPSIGDFHASSKITGTITTRTSDSACIVTTNKGTATGAWSYSAGGTPTVTLWWGGGRATNRANMLISSRTDNVVTLTGGSGTALPDEGTVLDAVWPSTAFWQEIDLDVEASAFFAKNYESATVGTGAITDDSADTLPDSYIDATQPDWWPSSLAYPPINPASPTFDWEIIPAGYRYVNGVEAADGPDVTAPTATANIPTGGATLNIVLTESCTAGSGGTGGVTLSASGGAVTATYASGDTTSTWVYNLSRTVNIGETVTWSYSTADGIEDGAGNDLAAVSGASVTNNSTQGSSTLTAGNGVSKRHIFR
jgi:hypothetical protein